MHKQLTPQLRFPEFDRKWEEEKLVNLSKKVAYGMNAAATTFDGVNKYLRITDIDEDSRSFIPKPLSSPDGEIEDKFILKKGDIVFARTGASVGKSYLYNEDDGKLLYAGFLIKFNISNAIPYFVFLQTFRESYRKWVQVYSMRSGQPGLNAEEYKLLKFNCPNIEEQQKIASFFADVDDKITKLTKKKELLEQYKKGIMQKIFNQELRFKDDKGNEFPKWKEKKLRDLGNTLNGLTGKTKEDFGIGKPYIQYKQIFDSSKININNCGFVEITSSDNQTRMQYGDVFFTTSSETPNEIGTASVLLDEVEEMYLNSFCFGFRVLQSVLYPSFSQFLFRSNSFRKKIIPLAQGSTRYNISKSSFLKLKVNLPSIEEQIKIANFLSDIDLKIEALNNKIENCKAFKKGLLQQMFV